MDFRAPILPRIAFLCEGRIALFWPLEIQAAVWSLPKMMIIQVYFRSRAAPDFKAENLNKQIGECFGYGRRCYQGELRKQWPKGIESLIRRSSSITCILTMVWFFQQCAGPDAS